MSGAHSMPWGDRAREHTLRLLSNPDAVCLVQNAAFDIPYLVEEGAIEFIDGYLKMGKLHDTMYAAQVDDPDSPGFSLDELASYYLNLRRWKHKGNPRSKPTLALKTWKRDFSCAACGAMSKSGAGTGLQRNCMDCAEKSHRKALLNWEKSSVYYNRHDAHVLLPIYHEQHKRLLATNQLELFENMMLVMRDVLLPMQIRGLKINPEVRDRIHAELAVEASQLQTKWDLASGCCNPNSYPQMRKLLYETWGLPVQWKRKKKKEDWTVNTDADAIESLSADHPEFKDRLQLFQDLKQATKWRATYTEIGTRIHPRYGPAKKDDEDGQRKFAGMAATSRIIAKGGGNFDGTRTPPIQQLPDPMKVMVEPDFGQFIILDWKQQELRLIAFISGDTLLTRQIKEGFDVFEELRQRFSCDRTRAKNVFYGGIAYKGSARAVAHELRSHGYIVSDKEVGTLIAEGRRIYPGISRWHDNLLDHVLTHRFVADPFGGRRYFFSTKNRIPEIINYPIQASGARMLWARLRELRECARSYQGDLAILRHDEVCADLPDIHVTEGARALAAIMTRPFPEVHEEFSCPVTVKVGRNWGETEPLDVT